MGDGPRRLPSDFFLGLAAAGARVPIGTDLVLSERADPEAVRHDGSALAGVVCEAAARWQTPLAIPLMDLRLEKADLVALLRPGGGEPEAFHFDAAPTLGDLQRVQDAPRESLLPEQKAQLEALASVARQPGLVPFGMAIGPFSLTTKLMSDPITALALAGFGLGAEDEPVVACLGRCLQLAEREVHRVLRAQLDAGAAAVIVCEPAASSLYVSPRQIADGSPVFDQFVIEPLQRLRALLDRAGAALVLHDCGELTASMVQALATRVHPAVLSLGSSRRLWEDAALVPEDVVLFGNLPSKHFHSDEKLPLERVRELTCELVAQMRGIGRPFILGSECDVLHVPGAGETIRAKVAAMLSERH